MKLENKRLQIEFAALDEIQTQRFDHTAIVKSVVLDGKHTFCTSEQILPTRRTSYGVGLCGEFLLPDAAESASAGEWFCKPGVGLMKQLEDHLPYDVWKTYEVRPFEVTAESAADQITFCQKSIPSGGYGIDIEKRFSLQDNQLILDIAVKNTGDKEVSLKEYQHNFVSLDAMPIDQGYVLDMNCDKTLSQIENKTLRQGDEIHLPSVVRADNAHVIWEKDMNERIIFHRSEEIDPEADFCWTLRHQQSSVSVSEETDFCPPCVVIWSVEHCMCTEFYQAVQLAPGETAHWRRTWTFND